MSETQFRDIMLPDPHYHPPRDSNGLGDLLNKGLKLYIYSQGCHPKEFKILAVDTRTTVICEFGEISCMANQIFSTNPLDSRIPRFLSLSTIEAFSIPSCFTSMLF